MTNPALMLQPRVLGWCWRRRGRQRPVLCRESRRFGQVGAGRKRAIETDVGREWIGPELLRAERKLTGVAGDGVGRGIRLEEAGGGDEEVG